MKLTIAVTLDLDGRRVDDADTVAEALCEAIDALTIEHEGATYHVTGTRWV